MVFKIARLMSVVLLAVFLTIFLRSNCYAGMRISPVKFEFKADENQKYLTGAVQLNSTGDEPVRLWVYPGYFEVSPDGNIQVNFSEDHPKKDIKNIFLNPREITLNPYQKQLIRFTIPDIDKLPDGESRAVLFIENKKIREKKLPSPQEGINANLLVKNRFAIPIYVSKGKVLKKGDIENLDFKKAKDENYEFELTVASKGNAHIRLNGLLQLIDKKEVLKEFEIVDVPVPTDKKRTIKGIISSDLMEKSSDYILKTKLYYFDEDNRKKRLIKEVKYSPDKI